jgi:hypothetical protein
MRRREFMMLAGGAVPSRAVRNGASRRCADSEDAASRHPFTREQRSGRDACCVSQGNTRPQRDFDCQQGKTVARFRRRNSATVSPCYRPNVVSLVKFSNDFCSTPKADIGLRCNI